MTVNSVPLGSNLVATERGGRVPSPTPHKSGQPIAKVRNNLGDYHGTRWRMAMDVDPSDPWDQAIKAVEALLRPIAVPTPDGGHIGHVVGELDNHGDKWGVGLRFNQTDPPNNPPHSAVPAVVGMVERRSGRGFSNGRLALTCLASSSARRRGRSMQRARRE
jgi:hypothetical protein